MVTPVFHELRRQFNSIPLYPSNTSNQTFILLSKHMLKCVSKLMEDSLNLRKTGKIEQLYNYFGMPSNSKNAAHST